MVVLRSQKLTGSSSSSTSTSSNSRRLPMSVPSLDRGSKRLRSADVSDDTSLDYGRSKRLRSMDVPPARSQAVCQVPKPRKERKYQKNDRKAPIVSLRTKYTTEEEGDEKVRPYATEAVRIYNEKTGANYKLVKLGYMTSTLLREGYLDHLNFTAKKTDAPEEIFFAEVTTTNGLLCVDLCKCLGPKDSISGDKTNGCYYCCTSNKVQHPKTGGFRAGGDFLFKFLD